MSELAMRLKQKVRVIRGSGTGLEGTVERIDEATGWAHILPDKQDSQRPAVLEGPFTRSEIVLRETRNKRSMNSDNTDCEDNRSVLQETTHDS